MREGIVKTLEQFKTPYVLAWAILSPVVTLLTPSEWLKEIVFCLILLFVLVVWGALRLRGKKSIVSNSPDEAIARAAKKAVSVALVYLQQAENKSSTSIRLRITKSVMESATVIGAETLAAKFLKRSTNYDITGVSWIFEVLKSQFSGSGNLKSLEGFDCSACRGTNSCNVAFFDHLSHFVYCRGTPLYETFFEQFSFLGPLLASRLVTLTDQSAGWSAKQGDAEIDPLATATSLHLCLVFKSLTPEQVTVVAESLLRSQQPSGAWHRPDKSMAFCGGKLDVITTHRCIEVLSLLTKENSLEDRLIPLRDVAITNACTFLLGAPLHDDPVSYERNSGVLTPEVYRVLGHIVQGLVKAGKANTQSVRDKIGLILKCQDDDGSFRTSGSLLVRDRDLLHYTDITAFMVRTLVFYAQSIRSDT